MIAISLLLAVINNSLSLLIYVWDQYVKSWEKNPDFKLYNEIEDTVKENINNYAHSFTIIADSASFILLINQNTFFQCFPSIVSIIFNIIVLYKNVNHQLTKYNYMIINLKTLKIINLVIRFLQQKIQFYQKKLEKLKLIKNEIMEEEEEEEEEKNESIFFLPIEV